MFKNFVLETCNNPGTSSTVNLAGAATGRVTFAAVFSSGTIVFYFLDDGAQAEWGYGAFTAGSPNTISRTTVIGNTSQTTSRLNFTGTTRVYSEVPAEQLPYFDQNSIHRVNGGAVGWQLINTYAPSGAASQPFPLSTNFRRFRLTLQQMTASGSGALLLFQFSSDGGSTYLTASTYTSIFNGLESGGGSLVLTSLTEAGVIVSSSLTANSTASPWDAEMTIWPGATSVGTRVQGTGAGLDNSAQYALATFGGGWGGTLVMMNYARIISSSGTITGTMILEGLA